MTSVVEPVVGRASHSVYEMHASIRHLVVVIADFPASCACRKIKFGHIGGEVR